MSAVAAIVPTEIVNTGRYDFTFLRFAPESMRSSPWGFLTRVDGAGSVNPFKGVQQGDWSSPEWRWSLVVYKSGRLLVQGEVDYSPTANYLADLFKDLNVGDFTLLVAKEWVEDLRRACKANHLPLTVHEVAQAVHTSGN